MAIVFYRHCASAAVNSLWEDDFSCPGKYCAHSSCSLYSPGLCYNIPNSMLHRAAVAEIGLFRYIRIQFFRHALDIPYREPRNSDAQIPISQQLRLDPPLPHHSASLLPRNDPMYACHKNDLFSMFFHNKHTTPPAAQTACRIREISRIYGDVDSEKIPPEGVL